MITQRETILHYWNLNVRSAKEIHMATNIPMRTIYNNLKKLEQNHGKLNRKKGSGRPKKISPIISKTIGQSIRRDSSISLRTLETKLLNKVTMSRAHQFQDTFRILVIIRNYQKRRRVEWAQTHLNDNWNKTVFTDETAFQLFRNTVERWYKNKRPTRRIPKDR